MPDSSDSHSVESHEAPDSPLNQQELRTGHDTQTATPFRFSLRTLFILTTAAGCGLFAIMAVVRWQNELKREREVQQVRESLQLSMEIMAVTLKWNGERGDSWPPREPLGTDGNPKNSWRFQLYPTFAIPDEDFPYPHDRAANWDSAANRIPFADNQLPYCFSNRPRSTETHVFAIIGADTAFDSKAVSRFSKLPDAVIVLMEVADSKTHWMQPGDYDVTTLLAATGRLGDTVEGLLPDRIHVLFADGEVWALSPHTPIDAVKPFFTITGAKAASREESLSKYRVDD